MLQQQEQEPKQEEVELPEGFRVEVKTAKDHMGLTDEGETQVGGITFERCGGGRRIVRKKIV